MNRGNRMEAGMNPSRGYFDGYKPRPPGTPNELPPPRGYVEGNSMGHPQQRYGSRPLPAPGHPTHPDVPPFDAPSNHPPPPPPPARSNVPSPYSRDPPSMMDPTGRQPMDMGYGSPSVKSGMMSYADKYIRLLEERVSVMNENQFKSQEIYRLQKLLSEKDFEIERLIGRHKTEMLAWKEENRHLVERTKRLESDIRRMRQESSYDRVDKGKDIVPGAFHSREGGQPGAFLESFRADDGRDPMNGARQPYGAPPANDIGTANGDAHKHFGFNARRDVQNRETPGAPPPASDSWDNILRKAFPRVMSHLDAAQWNQIELAVRVFLAERLGRAWATQQSDDPAVSVTKISVVPADLQPEFLDWFSKQIDSGLLGKLNKEIGQKRKRVDEPDVVSVAESHSKEEAVELTKRPRGSESLEGGEEEQPQLMAWPDLVRTVYPSFNANIPQMSIFTKSFMRARGLPDLKTPASRTNKRAWGIPRDMWDAYMQEFERAFPNSLQKNAHTKASDATNDETRDEIPDAASVHRPTDEGVDEEVRAATASPPPQLVSKGKVVFRTPASATPERRKHATNPAATPSSAGSFLFYRTPLGVNMKIPLIVWTDLVRTRYPEYLLSEAKSKWTKLRKQIQGFLEEHLPRACPGASVLDCSAHGGKGRKTHGIPEVLIDDFWKWFEDVREELGPVRQYHYSETTEAGSPVGDDDAEKTEIGDRGADQNDATVDDRGSVPAMEGSNHDSDGESQQQNGSDGPRNVRGDLYRFDYVMDVLCEAWSESALSRKQEIKSRCLRWLHEQSKGDEDFVRDCIIYSPSADRCTLCIKPRMMENFVDTAKDWLTEQFGPDSVRSDLHWKAVVEALSSSKPTSYYDVKANYITECFLGTAPQD
ncbi:hypothetical protein HDU85_004313 [Gaertneriomyces sp. JEL0708]|nr:hypothetical protein HDU85_004313 [Gaertneriomyces sp. JEL0708]